MYNHGAKCDVFLGNPEPACAISGQDAVEKETGRSLYAAPARAAAPMIKMARKVQLISLKSLEKPENITGSI
ncbi:hypothetical protein ACL2XO_19400 [Sodalis sp. RH15]|uniref:hypothetical protein n=1 Tax=Sodalis sp. RH15 TaxID=3394330 RepID=UPI0039B4835F